MVQIEVTTADGKFRTVDAEAKGTLMETLRDAALVEGACGGVASCGTCHIYLDEEWLSELDPIEEDEELMLEGLAEVVEVRPTSRLACQIILSEKLDGLMLEIAPAQ
jgi:2Fe-2S ferredoxin